MSWSYSIDPVLVSIYVYYLVKLIKKYIKKLDTVHVFELSTLIDLALVVMCKAFGNIEPFLDEWSPICMIEKFIFNSSRLSVLTNICSGEINRFLFIHWSSEYKTKVTLKKSIIIVAVMKILTGIVTVIGSIFDPESLKCYQDKLFACSYARRNNFYWTTIPFIVSSIIILCVSRYFIKMVFKKSTVSNSVTPNNGLNDVNENQNPAGNISSVSATLEKENFDSEIRRKNENPHMFFKIRVERKETPQCFPPILPFETAKKALSVNILSLCMLLIIMPLNLLNFYVFFKDSTCESDPNLQSVTRSLGLIGLIGSVFTPCLIEKKLDKFT